MSIRKKQKRHWRKIRPYVAPQKFVAPDWTVTEQGDGWNVVDVCTHRARVRVARPRCAHPLRAGEGNSPAPPLIWPYPSLTVPTGLGLLTTQVTAAGFSGRAARGSVALRKMACRPTAEATTLRS